MALGRFRIAAPQGARRLRRLDRREANPRESCALSLATSAAKTAVGALCPVGRGLEPCAVAFKHTYTHGTKERFPYGRYSYLHRNSFCVGLVDREQL